MEDYLIIGILLLILVFALLRMKRHFKGGCCSGTGNTIREKKALPGPVIGRKTLMIEGMHCENCEIRVENALNRLDHAACKASHRKKNALVSFSAEVPEDLLRATVEKMGYKVTDIR